MVRICLTLSSAHGFSFLFVASSSLSLSFRLYAFAASACWFALAKVVILAFLSLYIHWAIEPLNHGHWPLTGLVWMVDAVPKTPTHSTSYPWVLIWFDLVALPNCHVESLHSDGWVRTAEPSQLLLPTFLSLIHFQAMLATNISRLRTYRFLQSRSSGEEWVKVSEYDAGLATDEPSPKDPQETEVKRENERWKAWVHSGLKYYKTKIERWDKDSQKKKKLSEDTISTCVVRIWHWCKHLLGLWVAIKSSCMHVYVCVPTWNVHLHGYHPHNTFTNTVHILPA